MEPDLCRSFTDSVHSTWSPGLSLHSILGRLLLLTLLFSAEVITISIWLDSDTLIQGTALIDIMHDWGAWILGCIIGFAAIFVTFAYQQNRHVLERMSRKVRVAPICWSLFAAHATTFGVFVGLSFLLYEDGRSGPRIELLAVSWFLAGISAIAFGGFALVPWGSWVRLVQGTGYLWAYASTAVISACVIGAAARSSIWRPASHLTFRITKMFLSLFVSGIIADPARMLVGTQRFQVQIAPECSGLEGVGLILAFGILWLLVFRRECRFPQALAIIPLGVALIFLLNSVRIATLILIGNAGAWQIAAGGFHSQAGWIAFSGVSVAFCLVVQRVPWFTRRQQRVESLSTAMENPTAAFLLPFLVTIAAGMIAGAAKNETRFEWLYPLRFFGAIGMLWIFRRNYASLTWKCDWLAPVVGVIVFVIWIVLSRFSNPVGDRDVSLTLMFSPRVIRVTWITFRVLAAVLTVPLAEELAFRGFLMRRLLSRDFESIAFSRSSFFALFVSSVAFGLLQGGYWIAGTVAGILFGLLMIRRGRIGDPVVAHSTANALLAAYILTYHKWNLW